MTFNKILDTELDYMNFNMDKNIMIEFTDGHHYTYLKLHDFTDIEVFDEKFFDANKYGLKPNPNIYGIYEMKTEIPKITLLIVSINDILIVKTNNYEIIHKDEREEFDINSRYIKSIKTNISNFEISKIRLGTNEKLDVEFEVCLNTQNQKLSYMSKNYVEAFKIVKHSGKIENNSFLNNLDKVFPVKDSLKKGYYHHMKLNDNSISLELLFTGVNFDVQLFEEDC